MQGPFGCRVHVCAGVGLLPLFLHRGLQNPQLSGPGGERGRMTSDSPLDLGFAFICISIFTTKELNKKTLKDPVHQLLMLESFG